MRKLKTAWVRTAKHSGRTKRHECLSDGDTLFLQLMPTGAKCWVQVVQVKGQAIHGQAGGHRFVGLAEAEVAAFENRKGGAARGRAGHEDARESGRAGGDRDAARSPPSARCPRST